jgi:hypothetical protein
MKRILFILSLVAVMQPGIAFSQQTEYTIWTFHPLLLKMPRDMVDGPELLDIWKWAFFDGYPNGDLKQIYTSKQAMIQEYMLRALIRAKGENEICTILYGEEGNPRKEKAIFGYNIGDKLPNDGKPNMYVRTRIFRQDIVISYEYFSNPNDDEIKLLLFVYQDPMTKAYILGYIEETKSSSP